MSTRSRRRVNRTFDNFNDDLFADFNRETERQFNDFQKGFWKTAAKIWAVAIFLGLLATAALVAVVLGLLKVFGVL